MKEDQLSIYLNDHLAGATAGIDTAESCLDENRKTPLGEFMIRLLDELREDRETLKAVIERAGAKEEGFKKVSGWVAEKVNRLRLAAGSELRDLRRLEELEMLLVGIRGKMALWETLEQISRTNPRLRGDDFRALQDRAGRQMEQVERERIKAVHQAFPGG